MKDEPATKKDIINIIHDFWENMLEPKFDKIDKRFDKVDKRLDNLEDDMSVVKRDLNEVKHKVSDIQADLSDTPSRKEFESLKAKVDLVHATA